MLKAKSRISACVLCAPWSLPSLHLSRWRAFKAPCIFCYTKEKFSVLFSVWVRGISGFALYWQKNRGEKWLQHGPAGESKRSWTNEREARVAVNQVDKKESAHLLVILQGSSVCPALSAFLLSVHYWQHSIPIFFFFFPREFTWVGTFKIRPANKESHYMESNKRRVILVSWAAQHTTKRIVLRF